MLTPDRVTSDQLPSFETGLFDRIRENKLISLLSSVPFESLSLNSDVISNILLEFSIAYRDELSELVNGHLSWSDIGDYFSNLVDELGLDGGSGYGITSSLKLDLFSPFEQAAF
jgi:hypothetical protein